MLKIKSITKTFHGKTILDDVSLNVQKGEIAVLLGESGVGKSTLLRILNNLESIDKGSVTLDGKSLDLAQVNQKHTIGMVFQHFNLFEHLTVEQNITIALEKVLKKSAEVAHEIAQRLLTRYGLVDKSNCYVSQLSGGQKQRLAIARTLAFKPKIICLDEPTSALDPLLTSHVAAAIQELADEGYIVLIATHDTILIEKLNCIIYLMRAGSIVESVTSVDFAHHKDAYPQIKAFVEGVALPE
jgi:ABC-type polar amino acid transport system ATPase subunit